jgi:hypothetical protein
VRLELGQQLADGRREPRARAGDDRERVVQRGPERDGAQAVGVVRRAGVGAGPGPVRAPLLALEEAARSELAALLEHASLEQAA